jgi:hypothetical protein
MRIAPLFVATSLATILAGNMAFMRQAQAAAMDPREVTTVLARAQTLDSRCKILAADQSQDLRDLVARAEIALAGKYSVAIARETLAKGRAEGKTGVCNAATSAQVLDILVAGKQAASATREETKTEPAVAVTPAPVTPPEPKAAVVATPEKMVPPAPKVAATPTPKLKETSVAQVEAKAVAATPKAIAPKKTVVAQKAAVPLASKKKLPTPVATKVITEVKSKKKVSLASYSNLAEKYYVELKCRTMPMSSAKRLYANVLAQHRAAMASEGAPAVRKVLKDAQSRAGSQSCT